MIHLLIDAFPETVEADGIDLPIVTDFRDWLRFASMMDDKALRDWEKWMLLCAWFTPPPERMTRAMLQALRDFFDAKALEPDRKCRDEADDTLLRRPPTFSWEIDAPFLLADFRRFYGIDLLRIEYLHWWEFKALSMALPSDSGTMERIRIRSWDLSKESPERRSAIRREQAKIAIPFEMDETRIANVFAEMM